MVDAISRLFGKSSKKPTHSSSSDLDLPSNNNSSPAPSSGITRNLSEDDGFTLLNPTNPARDNVQQQSNPMMYPPLPPNPYPNSSHQQHYPTGTMKSQNSLTMPHVLDGVPFVLSGTCSKERRGERSETDELLDNVGANLESAELLLQSTNYDFRLEKSVIESEITNTMRRMQTY